VNFDQLQTEAARRASLEGWTEVSPPPDWASLINEAWREFSWETECVVSMATVSGGTVAGQAEYTLAKPYWKSLTDVWVNQVALSISSAIFEREGDPNWVFLASGTPTRAFLSAVDRLMLMPPPSTGGQEIRLRGIREGSTLSAPTDEPAVPYRFHKGIVYGAVLLHAEAYAQGASLERVQWYNERYRELVAETKRYLAPLRMRAVSRTVRARPMGRIWL